MLNPGGPNLQYANAGNGKLTIAWDTSGNPAFGDDETDAIMSLLFEAPYWADPSGKRRSLLPNVKTKDASTPGLIQQYTLDALQPIVDNGRISNVSAVVVPSGTGYELAISYQKRNGKPGSLSVPLTV